MDRVIKFRGKRIDNNEWIYGSLIVYENDIVSIMTGNFTPSKYVIPETVGQFTGLHDRNGTMIYEGDIVTSDFGYSGIVVFDHFIYAKMECTISDNIEVIGNVHDNRNLINSEL